MATSIRPRVAYSVVSRVTPIRRTRWWVTHWKHSVNHPDRDTMHRIHAVGREPGLIGRTSPRSRSSVRTDPEGRCCSATVLGCSCASRPAAAPYWILRYHTAALRRLRRPCARPPILCKPGESFAALPARRWRSTRPAGGRCQAPRPLHSGSAHGANASE